MMEGVDNFQLIGFLLLTHAGSKEKEILLITYLKEKEM